MRIYRIEVEYPDVVTDDMVELFKRNTAAQRGWDDTEFQYPVNKPYLSRSGAKARAKLFEQYGCKATVIQSKPVEWETA